MTTKDGMPASSIWPMPKFFFEVDFGNDMGKAAFLEVSGMDTENQILEYHKTKIPPNPIQNKQTIPQFSSVTLKRGAFVNNKTFWNWHHEIKMNTIQKRTILIKLLDDSGNTTMQWQLDNAWPAKITCNDLNSDNDEVAVDSMEIAHENLTIVNK